tara:strand:- start:4778 stop:4966 length:189 start_codon:yes stop_codon:yes gene_type:complete
MASEPLKMPLESSSDFNQVVLNTNSGMFSLNWILHLDTLSCPLTVKVFSQLFSIGLPNFLKV